MMLGDLLMPKKEYTDLVQFPIRAPQFTLRFISHY
jgi:hypothetical protein